MGSSGQNVFFTTSAGETWYTGHHLSGWCPGGEQEATTPAKGRKDRRDRRWPLRRCLGRRQWKLPGDGLREGPEPSCLCANSSRTLRSPEMSPSRETVHGQACWGRTISNFWKGVSGEGCGPGEKGPEPERTLSTWPGHRGQGLQGWAEAGTPHRPSRLPEASTMYPLSSKSSL